MLLPLWIGMHARPVRLVPACPRQRQRSGERVHAFRCRSLALLQTWRILADALSARFRWLPIPLPCAPRPAGDEIREMKMRLVQKTKAGGTQPGEKQPE